MPHVAMAHPDTRAVQAQLRDRRRAVGVQSLMVAQLAGITAVRYSQIESGWRQATPDQLRRLDNILIRYERALASIQRAEQARSLASSNA